MIYRNPGFFVVIGRFGSSPTPFLPLPSVSSTGDTQETEKERQVAGWEGDERGAESQGAKKAYSSIYHSILSALTLFLISWDIFDWHDTDIQWQSMSA